MMTFQIKVLHVSNAYTGGGSEAVFATSLEVLAEFPSDITHLSACCTALNQGVAFTPDLNLTSWTEFPRTGQLRYIYSPENCASLYTFILQHKPKVIHLHGFLAHLSTSVLRALTQCRSEYRFSVIQTVHSHELICANASAFDWHKVNPCTDCMGDRVKTRIFYRNCDRRGWLHSWGKGIRNIVDRNLLHHQDVVDHLIVPSEFVRKTLLQEGFTDEKITLIRNPVVIPHSDIDEERADEIVYFGRFSPEKNLPLLIDAVEKLTATGRFPRLKLKLIGEGEEAQRLHRQIESKSLQDVIEFHPFQARESLHTLIGSAKVMALPSNCLETFSLVIPEALALGIMPVVTDLGALREMVDWLGCGYCFNNGDVESLTATLENALLEFALSTEALEISARKVRTHLGGERYAKQLDHLYRKLASQQKF